MQTLAQLIVSQKCRRGKAAGTTKRGAFWLAAEPVMIRSCGGDGIGNNGADISFHLTFRHYRNGEVAAVIVRHSWHQNSGASNAYKSVPALLDCTTAEQVIVAMKSVRMDYGYGETEPVYSDYYEDKVTGHLVSLGIVAAEPAPDDQPAA